MVRFENIDLKFSGYIMMGLSLLFPIILYATIRSVFRYFLNLNHVPIVLLLLLLVVNLGVLVFLHVMDIRHIKRVYGNADKLIVSVLVFQPAYFVCRQDILGGTRKGSIIYGVVSTLEIVVVIFAYVFMCLRDVLELI